jgi:hypothetical protein
MEPGGTNGFRQRAVQRLTAELGPPLARGDSCQWVIPAAAERPALRLTLFLDGSPTTADGWLLTAESSRPERVLVAQPTELEELIGRCAAALGRASAARPA